MADYVLSAELSLKDKFTSKIKTAEYKSKLFNKTTLKTESVFQKAKKSSLFAAQGIKKFANETGNAYKKTEKLRGSVENLGKKLGKNLGGSVWKNTKRGILGITAGMTALTGYTIKGMADMEKYRSTLETVFKSQEKASRYMKWGNKFANETPYSNDDVIAGISTLASYGIEPDTILKEIGDMASGMNKPLEQAIVAFAKAKISGETEMLEEFGITKQDIRNYAKENLKIDPSEFITKGNEVINYDIFTDTLKKLMVDKFKDGMKKQADTFSGSMSTIFGVGKSGLMAMLGMDREGKARAGSFWDFIHKRALSFRNRISELEKNGIFDKWGKVIDKELVPSFANFVNKSLSKLKEWKEDGTLKSWADNTVNAFKAVKNTVTELFDQMNGLKDMIKDLKENKFINFAIDHGLATFASFKAGSMVGAAIGSFIPGVGTVAGGAIGGLAGAGVYATGSLFKDWLEDMDKQVLEVEENSTNNNVTNNSNTNTNTTINNNQKINITVNDKNSEMFEEMRKNLGIVNSLSY